MTHVGFAHALLAALLLASTSLHAQEPATAAIAVGIVWWPADPDEAVNALGSDIEDCLARHIQEAAPEVLVIRQRAIRDALFPLLEPATQPATAEAFAALLAREDVRARLARKRLRYLIVFAGGTSKAKPGGFIQCGYGYGGGGCLGFSWQDETTALDAALWSLDGNLSQQMEDVKVEGTAIMPAFGLPLPIPARTRANACRELGSKIALAIRKTTTGHSGNR